MLCETASISDLCLQESIAEQAERRRLSRKSFLRKARITMPDGRPDGEPAFCRDISREGIGLLHTIPLEPGRTFTLTIPLIGRELRMQCETNWCRPITERHHFSGSAHECVWTPQAVMLLSAALSQGLNRRLYRRYSFLRPVKIEGAAGRCQSAFCRDISRHGIGLLHHQPLDPGHAIVTLPSASGTNMTGTVDIRHCSPLCDGWYASGGPFPVEGRNGESAGCISSPPSAGTRPG